MKLILLFFILAVNLSYGQYSENDIVVSNFQKNSSDDDMLKVLVYDLNNDGNLDVIIDGGMIINQSSYVSSTTNAVVMFGDGNGGFNNQMYFAKPSGFHSISDINDYNNDGVADIIMYGFWQNGFTLYTGNTNGTMTFDTPQNFGTGTHGFETVFKDYDNDGDLDMLSISSGSAADCKFHVFKNTNNSFAKSTYSLQSSSFMRNYNYIDINGDGLMDVEANTEGTVHFLYQNSDHTFGGLVSNAIQSSPFDFFGYNNYHISVADYNNDNIVDMVKATDGDLNINLGTSTAPYLGFTATDVVTDFGAYPPFGQIYNAKIDDDDYEDVILYSGGLFWPDYEDHVKIYLDPFNYNNSFEIIDVPLGAVDTSTSYQSLVYDDFNNDGLKDILVLSTENDQIKVLLRSENLSIKEDIESSKVVVSPNPSTNSIHIQTTTKTIDYIEIFDVLGKNVMSKKVDFSQNSENTINVFQFESGTYIIKGYHSETLIFQQKIIKI